MGKSANKENIAVFLISVVLGVIFAWGAAWRVPNFASFLRNSKIIWIGILFLFFTVVFYLSREKILQKFRGLFSIPEDQRKFSRVWIFLFFAILFAAVFSLRSDFFDMRYPYTIHVENTGNNPLVLQAFYSTQDHTSFQPLDEAAEIGYVIQEESIVLNPNESLEFEHDFFHSPLARPALGIDCQGDSLLVSIDNHEYSSTCDDNTYYQLPDKNLNTTWSVILLLNGASIVVISLSLAFFLLPIELFDAKKSRNIGFHTFLIILILAGFLLATANELTSPVLTEPISGLKTVFQIDWDALGFDNFLTYLFIAVVLGLYYIVNSQHRWLLLLIASYLFLSSFDPAFPVLLLCITYITYTGARAISSEEDASQKKRIFNRNALSILGILLFFKYAPLLWSNASVWFGAGTGWRRILLPVGISFYSFTALSYLKDVQSNKFPVIQHFGKFSLYLAYFPKLLIGPIERPKTFFAELEKERSFSEQQFVIGLSRIGLGLFKRLLVSNRLAVIVDAAFTHPKNFTSMELIVGVLAFAFQVYVDFSAYCDIALGISGLFGIQLSENFEQPYFATSISEFWRRWHITFSTWLRDYVFLPLEFETRRVRNKSMQYTNTLITFLISGMWHGASLNFLIWGGLHGIYQIGEDFFSHQNEKSPDIRNNTNLVTRGLKILLRFTLVSIAWVFFRADNLQLAFDYLRQIASLKTAFLFSAGHFPIAYQDFWLGLGMIPVMLLLDFIQRKHNLLKEIYDQPLIIRWGLYLLSIFAMIIFGYYGSYEIDFVYMQF